MEALIIVVALFTFWTQHILLRPGDSSDQADRESPDLTDALKRFLEEGIEIKIKS